MVVVSDLSIKKIFFTVCKMHWSFYIFALCAVAGWSIGRTVRAITKAPGWLFED